MAAPTRTIQQSIHERLRRHPGIKWEIDRLVKAANRHIQKTLPKFRYEELAQTFLEDLAEVVSHKDWRPAFERTAKQLRDAAKHMRKAAHLALKAAKSCPKYAGIPSFVRESTSEVEALIPLPFVERLEFLIARQELPVIDPADIAPKSLLKAMAIYGDLRLEREAARLERILKARSRRFDRLGPEMIFIRDVQSFTGKPRDAAVARLLTDAFEVAGREKNFSPEAIRKFRERHLTS